jgi:DNA polymerase-4
MRLNPTTFYFKIRYEFGIKNSQSITKDRLFSEHFLIELAQSTIQQLDIHPNYKIHYIAISASNFANRHNLKTFCLMEYDKDVKFAALNEKLLKVRDKYGVDIVKYGRECVFQ